MVKAGKVRAGPTHLNASAGVDHVEGTTVGARRILRLLSDKESLGKNLITNKSGRLLKTEKLRVSFVSVFLSNQSYLQS